MLKQSELKKPLTLIVVLTAIAFVLQCGALACQAISGRIGINKTQLIQTTCNNSINTILSNSNTFYLVALACGAVAVLCLAAMFVLVLVGICKWNSPGSKYADSSQQPQDHVANNGQQAGTNSNMNKHGSDGDPQDQYFTPCKFVLGTVMYLVSLITTLGHLALIATVLIGQISCYGVMVIIVAVVVILSLIALILELVCFIKWQLERRKLNNTGQQTPNQPVNQNQTLSQANDNRSNQQTRQNLVNNRNSNMETIQPFRTQQDQMKQIKRTKNNKNNNLQVPNNNQNVSNGDYVSFNGKSSSAQSPADSNKYPSNSRTKTATNPKQKTEPEQTHKNKQLYSESPATKNTNNQPNNQNKKEGLTQNNNNSINEMQTSKGQKNPQRISFEASSKGQKHPTPKFILSQEENSRQEQPSREANNFLKEQQSFKKGSQKENDQIKQNKEKKQKNTEHQKFNDHSEGDGDQVRKSEQNFKQSRKEIMKNNGGKPFFKSPQKPKEPIPSNYRSPLQKYERQDEDNISKLKNSEARNYPVPSAQQSNLKTSISQHKLLEQQKKYMEQSNASSGRSRELQPQRERRPSLQKNMEPEMKNEQRRQPDERSQKKTKKTGMLIDYIRSRYAD